MAFIASDKMKPVILRKSCLETLARSTCNILLDVMTDDNLNMLCKITTADHKTLISINRASSTKLSKHKRAEMLCCSVQLLADFTEVEPN